MQYIMKKEFIKEVLLEQKAEIELIFKERIIEREVLSFKDKFISSNLIKVIMGVRRCGKSVLAHQLLAGKRYGYINFDDERFIGLKREDLNNCLEVLYEIYGDVEYILFDEIQNIEGWELFINRLRRKGHNIVITGSNSKLLSKELASHLTGRYISIELFPFSFREFLAYKGVLIEKNDLYLTQKRALIKNLLEEYIEYGGFPEIFNFAAKGHYLREVFDKIISRDIILRYGIRYGKDLKEVALFAYSNFSSKVSLNRLKEIFEIKSIHTVKNYLDYLQEAYLLFEVYPFSFKLKEQIKKPRKIFSIDTGLINAVVSRFSLDKGRLIENIVFLKLKREGKEVYYYSTPDYEVDLVIKSGLRVDELIQVCYSLSDKETERREVRSLIKASDVLKCNKLRIISWDEEGKENFGLKEIDIIPLWKFLLS